KSLAAVTPRRTAHDDLADGGRWRWCDHLPLVELAVAWLTGTLDGEVAVPIAWLCDQLGLDAAALARAVRVRSAGAEADGAGAGRGRKRHSGLTLVTQTDTDAVASV